MIQATNKQHSVLVAITVVVTMFAVRALFGEEITGFVDGLYVGFTDDV